MPTAAATGEAADANSCLRPLGGSVAVCESSTRRTTKDLTLTGSQQGVRCERIKQTLGGCREGWGGVRK